MESKSSKSTFKSAVIAFIFIGLLMFLVSEIKSCMSMLPDKASNSVTDTIVRVDTLPPRVYSQDHFYSLPGDTQYIEIPVNVDTAEILRRYFSCRTFRDSIIDTNLIAKASFTVCENSLSKFELNYKLLKSTTVISTTTTPIESKHNRLFIGSGIGVAKGSPIIAPEIMLISKKGKAYSLCYDVISSGVSGKFLIQINK